MYEILDLINRMSPYLLLGFFLAGLMYAFIPNNLYKRYLGGNTFKSVINATLLGIPLPLCSCGTIPTAMSLRKEGASKGATTAFLIATPQTGIDSIIATYSLMGLPFALVRPIAALVTSVLGGALVNKFSKEDFAEKTATESCCNPVKTAKKSFAQKLVVALRYAFIEMMQDIGRWLALGLIIAGAITVLVPDSFFALFADNSLLSMILVLVCAIPMYLCAIGSIPIAVALMLKGLSPGTALVLLMAGPAANAASILVINKVMGKKTLALYLISIIGGAMAFGLAIDYLLPREWFLAPLSYISAGAAHGVPYFNIGCSVVLGLLLLYALVSRFFIKKTSSATLQIKIQGLRCNKCSANAQKAILGVKGVDSVEIDLASGIAFIKGAPKMSEITQAVENLGFKVIE